MVNFSDFPAATPINGSGYYYSYYRNGCADNAWGSHLFRIEKDTAIKVAHIKGDGCGIKDGIFIYRVRQAKNEMIEALPLQTTKNYKEGKFGFIRQY